MNKLISMMLPVMLLCIFLITPAFGQDADSDGVLDDVDNCVNVPNGPDRGTCVKTVNGWPSGTGIPCVSGGCVSGQTCDLNQGDFNTNGKGDACECYADTNCDSKVDLNDLVLMKKEYTKNTCATEPFCYADLNGDGKVDLPDLVIMKAQYTKADCTSCARPVGVLFAVHGGMDTLKDQYVWDTGVQQFSYDPNNSVYQLAIWNPDWWNFVLTAESSLKFMAKFDFEYPRIGGTDPFGELTLEQLADMETALNSNIYGIDFVADWIAWMCGDCIDHYPYPRFLYYGPDGPGVGTNCTYCGEYEPGGPWADCDPDRYNVDGPVERLLKQGVYRIIMVDLTVGGVRFSKTYDVQQMTQKLLDEWKTAHGVTIPLLWVNDYSNLMKRSYPILPAGWTRSKGTLPTQDSEVLKNGSPNPVVADPDLAALQREAIEASFSGTVSDADTGVIILNHAINDLDEVFDPKMDDTVVLNENIKAQLIAAHPTMDPDNIIGARMGVKVLNPEAQHTKLERTRGMRGENLGHQYRYETAKEFPSGGADPFGIYHPWGYLYWDALDYLINTKDVQHIVIGFTQITTSSVLDMVEIPNQIGKEIGIKNWALWGIYDYGRYPGIGHPFADYWGNWVYEDCGEWELRFDNGTEVIAGGGTNPVTLDGAAKLVGQTSGAAGVIKQVIVENGGNWTSGNPSAGRIILKDVVGNFSDNETIKDDTGTVKGNALADGTETQTISSECCFVMGGCPDDGFGMPRPYPPPRLTPLPDRAHDLDPSLAYDLSDFGHLGYDPDMGPPDPNNPVQGQYTGTWAMYAPPDNDPGVGELLAKHVITAAVKPMIYMTNTNNVAEINVGESVTFQATASNGKTPYTYQWEINKDETGWTSVGGNSATWNWTPAGGDVGTYAIRCSVTDAKSYEGEVTWEDFVVSAP